MLGCVVVSPCYGHDFDNVILLFKISRLLDGQHLAGHFLVRKSVKLYIFWNQKVL